MSRKHVGVLAIAVGCSVSVVEARVTRIEVTKTDSPAAPARGGVSTLPYERLSGKFYG